MSDDTEFPDAAVVVGLNASRDGMVSADRAEVERARNDAEQKFSELREAVRAYPTFKALIAAERAQIERDVIDVKAWGASGRTIKALRCV